MNCSSFSILQWNVRSVRARRDDLIHSCNVLSPAIILISETWLPDNASFTLPGFTIFRANHHPHALGSGVLIGVRSSLAASPVVLPALPLDAVAVSVRIAGTAVTFASVYWSPSVASAADLRPLLAALPPPLFIGGDFNARHPLWGSPSADVRGNAIFDQFVLGANFSCLNDGSPTYFNSNTGCHSSLDLTFCSLPPRFVCSWRVADNSASDHLPVISSFSNVSPPRARERRTLIFPRADWPRFRASFDSSLRDEVPLSPLGDRVSAFQRAFSAASSAAIPAVVRSPDASLRPRWWNADVRRAVAARSAALKRARKSLLPSDLLAYRKAYAQARRVMRETRTAYWNHFCESLTPSSSSVSTVYRRARDQRGDHCVPALTLADGSCATSGSEKATALLSTFFPPVGSNMEARDRLSALYPLPPPVPNCDAPFAPHELERVLRGLPKSSPGPDGVHYKMLAALSDEGKDSLLALFNESLASGSFPTDWKRGRVLPFLKLGRPPHLPSSYRPISLVSCVGKILERMVLRRLDWFLAERGVDCPWQFGFTPGRSTAEPIEMLTTDVIRCRARGEVAIVACLDIRGAFDGVWHEAILAKLRSFGLGGQLYRWIESFLSDRSCSISCEGETASFSPDCGVPQGCVLSPRLFTLVINGLCSALPPAAQPALFADDVTLRVAAPDLRSARAHMQAALNAADSYGSMWGLPFSAEKSKFLVFAPRPVPLGAVRLSVGGDPLTHVSSHRILGVIVDDRLTFLHHVTHVRARCSAALALLRTLTSTSWGSSRHSLLHLFKLLVRSRVEYGLCALPRLSDRNAKRLAVVCNTALRIATGLPFGTANSALHVETFQLPLPLRQFRLSLAHHCRLLSRSPALFRRLLDAPNTTWPRLCTPALSALLAFCRSVAFPLESTTIELSFSAPACPPHRAPSNFVFALDWLPGTKSSLSTVALRSLALEEASRHPTDIVAFCDGALDPVSSVCGLGILFPDHNISLSQRLPPLLSIASVELHAIRRTLELAPPGPSLTVFSDSMSALALVQDSGSSSAIVRSIWATATDKFRAVHFVWVPSHCGIPGNEGADALASAALALPDITPVPVPVRDMVRAFDRPLRTKWSADWEADDTGRVLHEVRPVPGPWPQGRSRPRLEDCAIAAIRCGRARLPCFGFRCRKLVDPRCEQCGVPFDADHLLLVCPLFDAERVGLREACDSLGIPFTFRSVLGGNSTSPRDYDFILDALVLFVKTTIGLTTIVKWSETVLGVAP